MKKINNKIKNSIISIYCVHVADLFRITNKLVDSITEKFSANVSGDDGA